MFVMSMARWLCFSRMWPIVLLCALSSHAAAQAANIVFATGSATVIDVDGKPRKADRGAVLEPGETVDTGNGKAQLRFRDGATISLQPETQFRVEQFRFAEQNGKAGEHDTVVMRLLKGTLRAVSGLIGKERREQYRMDTVVGTIGIRGTEYGAGFGGSGLVVTTYVGLVEVCNSAGCAMAGAGQTLQVADGNTRPRLVPGANLPNLTPDAAIPQLLTPQQTQLPEAVQQTPLPHGPSTTGPSLRGPGY